MFYLIFRPGLNNVYLFVPPSKGNVRKEKYRTTMRDIISRDCDYNDCGLM